MHHPQSAQRFKQRRISLLQCGNEWLSFPVLTAVHVVCRRWLPSNGDQSLARIIDAFLDEMSGSISLSAAYKTSDGSLRFLQYLTSRELPTMDPILHRWEFNNVTGKAAAQGDLRTLQWLVESYRPGELLTQAVVEAVGNGHLHILEWLWENHRSRVVWGGMELCLVKESYHHDVVQWLRARTEISPENAQGLLLLAAENGDMELVRVLYETFSVEINAAVYFAAAYCQWEVVFWFADNCKWVNGYNLHDRAVKLGDLDTLKVLFDRGLVLNTEDILEFAAKCGQLHIVKWLYEVKGLTKAGHGYIAAVNNGRIDVLEYLTDKMEIMSEVDVDNYVMDEAVSLKTIQWLHFHANTRCSYRAMNKAAARGDLEMVQWLHANRSEGCSSSAMDRAAINGHLDMVKWLHANRTEGCSVSTMRGAAQRGHLEIVRWLHANRAEEFDVHGAMDSASACGHLELLQWFHENRDGGCTTNAMDLAALNGQLEVVRWLHHHRTEGCTTNAMDYAARNGHLEVVKWLHWNRSEGCTTKAIDIAAANGHMKVVKWLHVNRSMNCTRLAVELHFSLSGRLDVVAYLVSEFPECRDFHLERLTVSRLEVVEWLLAHTPNALEGYTLEVRSCNRYLCEWLRQHNWRGMVQNEFTYFSL